MWVWSWLNSFEVGFPSTRCSPARQDTRLILACARSRRGRGRPRRVVATGGKPQVHVPRRSPSSSGVRGCAALTVRESSHRRQRQRAPGSGSRRAAFSEPTPLREFDHGPTDGPTLGHLGENRRDVVEVDHLRGCGPERPIGEHPRQVGGGAFEHRRHHVWWIAAERRPDEGHVCDIEMRVDGLEPTGVPTENVPAARSQKVSQPAASRALDGIDDDVERLIPDRGPNSIEDISG